MDSSLQRAWHHNIQQYALLEYASLKQKCPDGIYLSLKSGSPTQWSGVFFVRKGPYAPAILRFQVSFPPDYPTLPPSITFTSDIFHPLVAPLTTYTYATESLTPDAVGAKNEERLSPGGFSLRHGFPDWFGRAQKGARSSAASSRDDSGSHDGGYKARYLSRSSPGSTSSKGSLGRRLAKYAASQSRFTSIAEVLEYMKRFFDDETTLDILPLEAAGNTGAWKAWRAYRQSIHSHSDGSALDSGHKQQDEWSWDGVWEERVRKGIDASITESALYGVTAGGDDLIRFINASDDLIQEAKAEMIFSVDSSGSENSFRSSAVNP